MGNIYKWVNVNTAAIIQHGDKTFVVPTNKEHYEIEQAYKSSSRIYAGMFAGILKMFNDKKQFFNIPRAELKKGLNVKGYPIDSFDGLSLSSINRPFTRLFVSKNDKAVIERWANSFALITDGTRNLNTFFYQMPTVKLSKRLLNMFHKSKIKIDKLNHELFGIPGVTVFVDKDNPETDKFLYDLLGMPISLKGDGLIVSDNWMNEIKVLTDLKEELDLPEVVKMQGLARSKGITIARFRKNVKVRVMGQEFDVDVIMNTQGKRKNKAANITLSGMRMRKYLGEEIETIDTANIEQLIELKNKYRILTGELIVNGEVIGIVPVGINKYYIDLTHDMNPKISVPNLSYVQAENIYEAIDYPIHKRMIKRKIKDDLEKRQNQIEQLEKIMFNIKYKEGLL
jgi:hypothetical protein